jgi:hypothetical protein
MPKVFPPTFPPGAMEVSDDLYRTFYEVNGDSLEVINGRLDPTNMVSSFGGKPPGYNFVQPGALSGGGGTAGTANLDYFSGNPSYMSRGGGHFPGVGYPPLNSKRYLPIPGANVEFYLPFDAYVLLTWSITWTNDNAGLATGIDPQLGVQNAVTDVALFIDDSTTYHLSDNLNTAPFTRYVGDVYLGETDYDLQDRYKSRVWSGHCWIDGRSIPALSAGYHSAGLRICQHQDIKQSRVRARSMQYMYFKYGDS